MDAFDWQAFHFLRPLALLGLVPAVVLAVWYTTHRLGKERFASLLSPMLQDVLLTGADGAKRWTTPVAIAAMLGLGAIAVAGPAWQRQDVPAREVDDALIVLLDLSLSMYAEDTLPSRLARAKRELADLLLLREEGTTALIAYAGDAHIVTPLTDDVDTIRHMTDSLTPEIMPVLGSRTDLAIGLANQLLDNSDEENGQILLITDGIRGLESSASACDPRFPLSILGVGTAAGAPVPVPVGEGRRQVLADSQSNQVIARLDSGKLEELAGLCGGAYSNVRVSDDDLMSILPGLAQSTDQFRADESMQQVDLWIDMAYVFAIPIALLLLVAFRRGALPVMLAALVCVPDARADFWDDLWQRRDQQAFDALQQADAETASGLFEDQRWRAVADFRSGDFDEAAINFDGLERKIADDYYNLGNSLAFSGEVQQAIDAYEQAFIIDPEHADAAHNKGVLEQLQSDQQQQSDSEGASDENRSDADQGHSSQRDDNQTGQEGASEEQQQPGQQSEQSPMQEDASQTQKGQEQSEGESSQELAEQQAEAEQETTQHEAAQIDAATQAERERERIDSLLRRVPDDPGGLLRKKFQHETRVRAQAGEPRVDSEQPW